MPIIRKLATENILKMAEISSGSVVGFPHKTHKKDETEDAARLVPL